MNKRSLRILEFNKILSMVTEYATSPMAKRRVDRMKPQRDIEQIRKLQEETNDALNRLIRVMRYRCIHQTAGGTGYPYF